MDATQQTHGDVVYPIRVTEEFVVANGCYISPRENYKKHLMVAA